MSFTVGIIQRPLDEDKSRNAKLVTAELSSDQLQVKLARKMKNIVSINGINVTMEQKIALFKIGRNIPISVIEHDGEQLIVKAKFGGRFRTVGILPNGDGVNLDGWDKPIVRYRTLPAREWGRV